VAIEDSSTGVAAARAAGLKTVAIPHWLTERHDLSAADLIVEHAGVLTVNRLDALIG
jgi:beta-phosphoglucomutase-like phosphatase (HAD superfamily)